MTHEEYLKKRASYMTSNAPHEEKEKAIANLDAEYLEPEAAKQALEDFYAAAADLDDVGN